MFERKPIQELTKDLRANTSAGLTEVEAAARLQEYGKNALAEEKPKSSAQMFLEQLNEPLIFVLFVAAGVSMLLREFGDTIIIMAVILLNSIVGVIQEGKAQKALDALKKLTSPSALVKREGQTYEIPSEELVPGDLVILEAGRQIPADLRLISSASLKIEESALTGESHPIEKDSGFLAVKELPLGDRRNMAYMSTNIVYGRGSGLVTATGMHTEIGRIAGMISRAHNEPTPLQKRLADLGKLLSIVAVFLCVALFGIAIIQHRNVFDMLLTAISLAVAAVPEGLPAIVTIVLALSVSRMVKVHTIVRRLPSVETLGAVSIVCSDKTGTLTQNKMTVVRSFVNLEFHTTEELDDEKYRYLVEGLVLCSDATVEDSRRIGDPTELALVELGIKCHKSKPVLEHRMPRINELPFDSSRKMMTTMHRSLGTTVSYTKGAPDVILERCTHILLHGKTVPLTAGHRKEILSAMNHMSADALRVLALSMRRDSTSLVEKGMTFVGLVGMMDPVRPEVYGAVQQFRHASVRTVMITGDHVNTAYAIARDIGIADHPKQCIEGAELDKIPEAELPSKIKNITVFARVSSEHKVRIVKAFKSLGNIVAMTGDGVNDAPSLKTADIGIAMGMNGTDVAKNASDLILTDDNFATIEKAISEGRGIYENIKKSILFLLSSNFGEIITMFLSILIGLPSPLKASHILWINLITDSLPALALGVDENDKKLLMSRPPRNPKENLFAHGGLFCTLFYGTLIALISLVAFMTIPYAYLQANHAEFTMTNIMTVLAVPELLARAQTYAFTVLGLSQLFHAIGMRNVEESVFKIGLFNNKLMILSFVLGFLLQFSVTEIPTLVTMFGTAKLSHGEWGRLLCLASLPLWAHEIMLIPTYLTVRKKHSADDQNGSGESHVGNLFSQN